MGHVLRKRNAPGRGKEESELLFQLSLPDAAPLHFASLALDAEAAPNLRITSEQRDSREPAVFLCASQRPSQGRQCAATSVSSFSINPSRNVRSSVNAPNSGSSPCSLVRCSRPFAHPCSL